EGLRVSGVRTEPHGAVVEAQVRHARSSGTHIWRLVKQVARPELVQHRGAESVNVADLAIGVLLQHRVAKGISAAVTVAYRVGKAEAIRKTVPIELGEETILRAEVIVQPG